MTSKKDQAWEKAKTIQGKNPDVWRKDQQGNKIRKGSYGTIGKFGWEAVHLYDLRARLNDIAVRIVSSGTKICSPNTLASSAYLPSSQKAKGSPDETPNLILVNNI